MRAIVCHTYGPYSNLKLEAFPRPTLPARGVRIAIDYASVSFATTLVVAGKYQRKPPLPFVPGTEVVGIVTEIAAGVTACTVGDRVLAILDWGGFAEEVCVTEHTVYRLPALIDSTHALHAGISYGTAYGALVWRGKLNAGENLLVLGAAGGVGLAAVELGHALGARVIAAASHADKCALARAHGADDTINYSTEDLRERTKALTQGRGADVVFDPIGGDLFDTALRAIAMEGRMLTIGYASGRIPSIPANILLVKDLTVAGFNFGAYVGWSPVDERARFEKQMRAMYTKIFDWVIDGTLRPVVSDVLPLEHYVQAQDLVISRQAAGKVLLKVR
jgi:NADPH2:quinone reductase